MSGHGPARIPRTAMVRSYIVQSPCLWAHRARRPALYIRTVGSLSLPSISPSAAEQAQLPEVGRTDRVEEESDCRFYMCCALGRALFRRRRGRALWRGRRQKQAAMDAAQNGAAWHLIK
jgi:hypothetical protein